MYISGVELMVNGAILNTENINCPCYKLSPLPPPSTSGWRRQAHRDLMSCNRRLYLCFAFQEQICRLSEICRRNAHALLQEQERHLWTLQFRHLVAWSLTPDGSTGHLQLSKWPCTWSYWIQRPKSWNTQKNNCCICFSFQSVPAPWHNK